MTDHQHQWRLDRRYPTLAFGKFGVSWYVCVICGESNASDPFTGKVKRKYPPAQLSPDGVL